MFIRNCFENIFVIGLLLTSSSVTAVQEQEGISEGALAKLTSRVMPEFNVPGMAIGIVKE